MRIKKHLLLSTTLIFFFISIMTITFSHALSYQVQSGDTFWKIAQKHNVSTSDLLNANNANQHTMLYPGQNIIIPVINNPIHTVVSGETYWIISNRYQINFQKLLELNNASTSSMLNIGDKVKLPSNIQSPPSNQASSNNTHVVKQGETFWIISRLYNLNLQSLLTYNNANQHTVLNIGQTIKIPTNDSKISNPKEESSTSPSKPTVTYDSYTVKSGDTAWTISQKFKIPYHELLQVNNLTTATILHIGDVLKIPVYNIPIKPTPGEQYGELLDWWTEAQYVVPINSTFEVVDFYTGKSFFVKRTIGANHADVEPLTISDTNKMKEIWGGSFSWARRPVIVKINGRKIAASATAMPHAGNDNAPPGAWTQWRSENYGAGINHNYIQGNGAHGHIDIFFLNSTRHIDGAKDPAHQKNVLLAAGQ